ncbi:MAG: hypothetical protein RSB77_07585 [Bacilli bacterium]
MIKQYIKKNNNKIFLEELIKNKDLELVIFNHDISGIDNDLIKFGKINLSEEIQKYTDYQLFKCYSFEDFLVDKNIEKNEMLILERLFYKNDANDSFQDFSSFIDLVNQEYFSDFDLDVINNNWEFCEKQFNLQNIYYEKKDFLNK